MREDNTDQPPMEPPVEVLDQPPMEPLVEVPPPPAYPLEAIESKLLRSTWLVISDFNDRVATTVNIRDGFYTVHGPFGDHINEIFDLFDEYRGQLELMRTNLIKAAREVDAGTRPIIHELEPSICY